MQWKTGLALLSILVACAGTGHAADGDGFKDLREHLLAGDRTTSVVELDHCQQTAGDKVTAHGLTGGYVIDGFISKAEPDEQIVYSHMHPTIRKETPVLEFIRYRIHATGTAIVTTQSISPKSFEPVGSGRTFECRLGDGLRFVYR